MNKINVSHCGVLLMSLILISCTAQRLETYTPNKNANVIISKDELQIKNFLIGYQRAWNSHNMSSILTCYSEDAKISFTKDKVEINKNEFRNSLHTKINSIPRISLGTPKIQLLRLNICQSGCDSSGKWNGMAEPCHLEANVLVDSFDSPEQFSFTLTRKPDSPLSYLQDGGGWKIAMESR